MAIPKLPTLLGPLINSQTSLPESSRGATPSSYPSNAVTPRRRSPSPPLNSNYGHDPNARPSVRQRVDVAGVAEPPYASRGVDAVEGHDGRTWRGNASSTSTPPTEVRRPGSHYSDDSSETPPYSQRDTQYPRPGSASSFSTFRSDSSPRHSLARLTHSDGHSLGPHRLGQSAFRLCASI